MASCNQCSNLHWFLACLSSEDATDTSAGKIDVMAKSRVTFPVCISVLKPVNCSPTSPYPWDDLQDLIRQKESMFDLVGFRQREKVNLCLQQFDEA